METKIGRVAAVLGVAAFLFFGAKGCIVTVWSAPTVAETFTARGADGRQMALMFLPQHDTMIWYSDPTDQRSEGILTRMKGCYGTHYFWRVWHIEGPSTSFGYRIYPAGVEPVQMEIQVLEKYSNGLGKSSLPEKGRTVYTVMLFGRDTIECDGTTLNRVATDEDGVRDLLAKLGGPRGLK